MQKNLELVNLLPAIFFLTLTDLFIASSSVRTHFIFASSPAITNSLSSFFPFFLDFVPPPSSSSPSLSPSSITLPSISEPLPPSFISTPPSSFPLPPFFSTLPSISEPLPPSFISTPPSSFPLPPFFSTLPSISRAPPLFSLFPTFQVSVILLSKIY